MGIAGFFLWLLRAYGECVDEIPKDVVDAALDGRALPASHCSNYVYDNFYVDMNGLIHPCCHDTAPLPEPESEEEMFERMFDQLDLLVKVVRPRKCLVLCIDGVAPRSKMNQQRSRRFRAAEEGAESEAVHEKCAALVVDKYSLPKPHWRARWDHNVITPATEFMERVAMALEWFIVKKLNEDEVWKHLAVVFSDAHVPGEGEHKIMEYIRGLRSQPGYDPMTSHVIHGMDADLVCLGLSTHEAFVSILRNQLTDTFKPDHNKFCYFNLHTYRQKLRRDFDNIPNMDFERVIDDFVYLCFFVGNDFLPHVPLISIKTKGIELLLDHYVRHFGDHGYLTTLGEVDFGKLRKFLGSFVKFYMPRLTREYHGILRATDRAKQNVEERCKESEQELQRTVDEMELGRCKSKQAVSDKVFGLLASVIKERMRLVADRQQLPFSYLSKDYRDAYYTSKFGWSTENREDFEAQVKTCCGEYLRGTQWVMRYYTQGCPSWEWFYPYHYAPLLQDLGSYADAVDVEMNLSAPLHPVEQLLAVLPRQSVHALPEPLHEAVMDPNSILGRFYPDKVDVDFSEANFSYQGVLRIPFINSKKLSKRCRQIVDLEDDVGESFVFCNKDSPLAQRVEQLLLENGTKRLQVPESVAEAVPIAGVLRRYKRGWPLQQPAECPDKTIAETSRFGSPVAQNAVRQYRYETNTEAAYNPVMLVTEAMIKAQREQRKAAAAPAAAKQQKSPLKKERAAKAKLAKKEPTASAKKGKKANKEAANASSGNPSAQKAVNRASEGAGAAAGSKQDGATNSRSNSPSRSPMSKAEEKRLRKQKRIATAAAEAAQPQKVKRDSPRKEAEPNGRNRSETNEERQQRTQSHPGRTDKEKKMNRDHQSGKSESQAKKAAKQAKRQPAKRKR